MRYYLGSEKEALQFLFGVPNNDPELKSPSEVWKYVLKEGPTEKYEHILITDLDYCVSYARKILLGRFEKAEDKILTSPLHTAIYMAYCYPNWEQGKEVVVKSPSASLEYALITDKRFPEGEEAISRSTELSITYAREILNKRFELYEKRIMKNPLRAVEYAEKIIKGRFIAAEPYIAKHPCAAVLYCVDILKCRWPEAEPAILKHGYSAIKYVTRVIKGPWLEAEEELARSAETAFEYADYLNKRFIQGEETVQKESYWAYWYARKILKDEWPEAEEAIRKEPQIWRKYEEHLLDTQRSTVNNPGYKHRGMYRIREKIKGKGNKWVCFVRSKDTAIEIAEKKEWKQVEMQRICSCNIKNDSFARHKCNCKEEIKEVQAYFECPRCEKQIYSRDDFTPRAGKRYHLHCAEIEKSYNRIGLFNFPRGPEEEIPLREALDNEYDFFDILMATVKYRS